MLHDVVGWLAAAAGTAGATAAGSVAAAAVAANKVVLLVYVVIPAQIWPTNESAGLICAGAQPVQSVRVRHHPLHEQRRAALGTGCSAARSAAVVINDVATICRSASRSGSVHAVRVQVRVL